MTKKLFLYKRGVYKPQFFKMSIILLCGVPGSGKTVLANNIKKQLDEDNKKNIIITEPQVEKDAFKSPEYEKMSRREFKSEIMRHITDNDLYIIADGMNFIKGYRYELFCVAREFKARWVVAYCEATAEEAFERSIGRYKKADMLELLIERMEVPDENKNEWDKPIFRVKDPNDMDIVKKITEAAQSDKNRLIPKSATSYSAVSTTTSQINYDQIAQNFCNELLEIQQTAKVPSDIDICGIKFHLKKKFTSQQLRKAKREFGLRMTKSKAEMSDLQVVGIFADTLDLII